jgi:hypothetical protein
MSPVALARLSVAVVVAVNIGPSSLPVEVQHGLGKVQVDADGNTPFPA